MANLKRVAKIGFMARGDGSNKTFAFSLATNPVWMLNPFYAGDMLQTSFTLATLAPSDVDEVTIDSGNALTSASIALGVLSITFATAPTSGNRLVYASLLFD